MLVLVEDAAEAIASADVKAGGGGQFRDRCGQRAQWPGARDSLMWPVGVVELLELAQCVQQVPLVPDQGPVEQLASAGLHPPCPRAGNQPRGSRQPGRAGTAATSGLSGAAPDRCPQHAGSPTRWTARSSRRASPVRRGCGGVPTADSPLPGERPGGRRPGPSAGGRACAACWCRTCCQRVCGARPGASQASRGRRRSSACAVGAVPARRATPGRPARTVPGRHSGAAPRSRAGVRAARHPSPGHCGTPGRSGRVPGTSAGRRS